MLFLQQQRRPYSSKAALTVSPTEMAVAVDSARWLLRDVLLKLRRVEEALSLVGILYLGKISAAAAWDLLIGVRTHIWPKLFKRNLTKEYGTWAVIAGAEDGMGRGYADVLAGKGMNVLLVSVTYADLEDFAHEIRNKYNVQVEVMDVSICIGELNCDYIRRRFAGKEIGILVNNITGMNSDTAIICGTAQPDLWRPLGVGVAYVPAITGLVLPAMMGQHKGAVVNVCSPTATLSLSRFHVYTAAKSVRAETVPPDEGLLDLAFLGTVTPSGCPSYPRTVARIRTRAPDDHLAPKACAVPLYHGGSRMVFLTSYSEVLRHSLQSHGIVVQTVLPAEIPHKVTHYTGMSVLHGVFKFVTPHQSVFAAHALSTLGYAHITSGYWLYGVLAWVMECSPLWLAASFFITRLSV
ncbi:inactive hydroxysteroid dehydrogenase-like protein 1 isoform X2 [Scylla paramamosain]|uniref:inactive hydroxysteroid dehydrogenase-like protein 1 isoform X2 n=1 Tax=Scylla paramamosain TaxID=85552 RepID=UPI0030834F36